MPHAELTPSTEPIDVIIPIVAKDLQTLPLCLQGVRRQVQNTIKDIYIVAPQQQEITDFCARNGLIYVDEASVFGYSPRQLGLKISPPHTAKDADGKAGLGHIGRVDDARRRSDGIRRCRYREEHGYGRTDCDERDHGVHAAEGDELSGVRWLQKGKQVDPAQKNVRTIVDAAVKEVADLYPLYAKKAMKVHIDPVLADAYRRESLEEYKWLKNQDGTHKNDIDFSNFTFAEMEGMRGTGCFFITPKENFKHLMSHNPQNVTLRFQEQDYEVKVFGEWWEGTGFWMGEAIFAYISPAAATKYAKPAAGGDNAGGEGGGI